MSIKIFLITYISLLIPCLGIKILHWWVFHDIDNLAGNHPE